MFLIRHAAWVTPLNFLIVRLESHALLYYDPAAMLERISSPIGVEAPEVVEMCGDPLPVRFAWLASPNDSVIADTDPRLAKLDIFFLTVVAAPLGCSFPTTTWSGIWLHRKFQIAIHILGHKICVVMWIWAPWILQTTRDMLFRYYFIYLFAIVKNRKYKTQEKRFICNIETQETMLPLLESVQGGCRPFNLCRERNS